ncbi:MAG: methyltransferase domain-containing protein [Deltaproteobacteria bacterium]|nr:methyltransferase domain-containing protein [Deltaproteobacteria bacterium]MBT7205246.1 methyltransferase domain-containing protein [Deltaproteobacteria bacterium]
MSITTILMDDQLLEYLRQHAVREPKVLRELREETQQLPNAGMQISSEQGQLMAMLVRLVNARKIIEVGTFTGYSSTVMALAMPPEGQLIACDVSEEYTRMARKFWQKAGVEQKVQLILGNAKESLKQLLQADEQETFDLAFIDADKTAYVEYYEFCLQLLRPGGLILVDNVLWGGQVADSSNHDMDTEALRTFNVALSSDQRIDLCMVPIGDGLTMARKR